MILSTEAIVLRTYPFGDTSRIAVLLTRDRGKMRVMAKGVRGPRSRMGSQLELFSVVQAVYYDKAGRELQLLKSADPLRVHPGLGADAAHLAFGSAALELCDQGVTGEESGPECFALLAEVLERLEHAGRDRLGLIFASFELEVAACLGYRAAFAACPGCGSSARERLRFHPEDGALVCAACAASRGPLETVSAGAADWLRYLNGDTATEPPMPGGDRGALREAARLIQLFLAAHLHNFRGLKSLEMLKRLEVRDEPGPAPAGPAIPTPEEPSP
ncbi:MAG: DNA repair protein RecO [Candidatus Eisenbacteria bacterium]|nr:DNA repair protein RecO [Candidatus Eisenbacteria bacterium]